MNNTPFQFVMTNTSSRALNYSLLVQNDEEKQAECKLENGEDCKKLNTDFIRYSYKKNDGEYSEPLTLGEVNDVIHTGIIKGNESISFSIIIWIDSEATNEIMNSYFFGKLVIQGNQNTTGYYQEVELNGADPVLTETLVPVMIDNKGIVKKANPEKEWYSYSKHEWANAVVLKDNVDSNTMYDLSGNGNNATIYGATMTSEGLSFDGEDDYAKIDMLDWNSSNEFTVEFKAKIDMDSIGILFESSEDGTKNNAFFIDTEEAGDKDILLTIRDNENSLFNIKYANNIIKEDEYYTFAVTFDADNESNNFINIYVNGIKQNLSTFNNFDYDVSNFILDNHAFYIGSRSGSQIFTKMTLSSLKIYNRELTQTEIENNLEGKTTKDNLMLMYELGYQEGEIIPEEAIESYFVWIPKYSYQLWDLGNYTGLTTIESKEHTIPVRFGLNNTSDTNTGECTTPGVAGESGNCKVGDYMTHPAFLAFDTNGLWVGKFDTGFDGADVLTTTEMNTYDKDKIIIKPNTYIWRNNKLGNMFKAGYDYLRNDESHMMKNTEWGSVAYLQHSKYGSQASVRINNNKAYITGYAAKEEPIKSYNAGNDIEGNRIESTELGKDGKYTVNYLNPISTVASTTGNYTGIYDMSGGAWEYVMGYTIAASTVGGASGITDLYSDFFTNSTWEKYYDKYYSTTQTNYNLRILGDATGELGGFDSEKDLKGYVRYKSSWYQDYAHFNDSSIPWIERSAAWHHGYFSGIFAFNIQTGEINSTISFRIVLSPTK